MATPDPSSYVSSTIYLENKPSGNIKLSSSGYVSTDNTYYAWGPYRDHYVYTTSATPTVGSKLYEYENGNMIWSADSIAAGNVAYAGSASVTNGNGYSYDRDNTEDIVIPVKPEHLYAWTWADGNETYYTKTSAIAFNTPLYDKDSKAVGSISGFIINDDKFSSDLTYAFTNEETLSVLTNLYNDEFITVQASDLEDFIATILGLQPSDISLDNLRFVFSEVYTDSMGSNITSDFYGINVDPDYYFLPNSEYSSNRLALFLFLGTDRAFFIGYFDNGKIDVSKYGSVEVMTAMEGFCLNEIRTQTDFHRIFLDTQSCDITTGYLGVEVTDETFNSESGSLDILAGDKGNTLLYCFDANSPWKTDEGYSCGTTTLAKSIRDFGELTSDSHISITSISWIGLSSIFDLIESSNTPSYDRDLDKDIIEDDTPKTLYTLTPTVEVGTHLYDAEGNDTGLTVGTVNQDGSFILAEEPTL